MLFNMLKQEARLWCHVSKIDKSIRVQQHTLDLLAVISTVCETRSSTFLVTPFPTECVDNVQKWWEHGEACQKLPQASLRDEERVHRSQLWNEPLRDQ
jgi:hypothetical protein